MSTPIEIGSNVVALLQLPIAVKPLASIIHDLEKAYGKDLRMTEQPKGWLQFFKPDGNVRPLAPADNQTPDANDTP